MNLLHEDDEKILTYISEKCYEINKQYYINYKFISSHTGIPIDEIMSILFYLETDDYIENGDRNDDEFDVSLTLKGRRYVRDNELKS